MTEQKLKQKLMHIVKLYLPQDVAEEKITPQAHLMDDLNINSAHLVDIALDIEDEFDITLDEDDMEEMQTVEKALTIVRGKTRS